jgi:hypothetical protein
VVKKTALLWLALAFCLLLCGCCSHRFEQLEYREATCREEGIEIKRCTKCNELHTVHIPQLAHLYKRTELAPGIALFTCALCGDSYTEELDAVPTETEATKVPETTEGQKAETPWTATQPTGAWASENTAHSYKLRETKEATCAAEGYNLWYCDHCGDAITQTLGVLNHSYTEKQYVAPDCIHGGRRILTCTGCGHSKEEAVESLGHDYGLAKITKAATCTAAGVQSQTCTRCGDSCKKEIAPLGHEKRAATCENAAKCGRCGTELAPPLGHAPQNGSCGRCGKVLNNTQKTQQLEAERQRHALAVEAINREIEALCLANEETVELFRQRYGIGQLLTREAYEERERELAAQIASVEDQFYNTQDPAQRQNLQQQWDALKSERQTVGICLRILDLLEENQALEEARSQRLAEENRIHEAAIKEIEEQYS